MQAATGVRAHVLQRPELFVESQLAGGMAAEKPMGIFHSALLVHADMVQVPVRMTMDSP